MELDKAVISSCMAETLSFLYWLDSNMDLEAPTKVQIQNLRIKSIVLNIFFACNGKFQIQDKNLKALLSHMQLLCPIALQDIQLVWFDNLNLPENLNSLISSAVEKLDVINPLIQQLYAVLSNPARSISCKDDVVEFIEALVENMKKLLCCKAPPVVHVEKEIKALSQDLLFLRNFLVITENRCGAEDEIFKKLLRHAESVADNTAYLLYLCSEDSTKINDIKTQFSCELERIKPIDPTVREFYIRALKALESSQVSDFFVDEHFLSFLDSLLGKMIELSNLKANPMISVIYQIEALHDELKILKLFLVDSSAQQVTDSFPNVNDLLLHIKIVVYEIASVIYSCFDSDITEELVEELNLTIGDLLQEFKVIKEKARVIYDTKIPKLLRSNFPKTNELGFIDFIIQNLKKELLNSKADPIVELQHQMEAIHEKIVSLKEDFIEIAEQPSEDVELKDVWECFKNTVYHTEYVIDLIILREEPLWWYKLGLFGVIEEIKQIRKVVDDMKDRYTNNTIIGTSSQPKSELHQVVHVAEMPINHVELFEDEAEMITEQLINGLTNLHILSIVGMPGIGKTTLANSLYENPAVHLNFHIRAKCCVTQTYDKRRLLIELLQQVTRETDSGGGINGNDLAINLETDPRDGMSDNDLAMKLYRSLKGQKYLIFFDDLWDICTWYDMRTSFPDDNKGSRIIFTSRFHDIASQIDCRSLTFPIHQLSDAKSWELLQVNLFKKESCPQELLEVGKQLARKCKGLPLAINLIAGLLNNMERREASWMEFTCNLNEHLLEGQHGCMSLLELSYNHLPSQLKPCFLYFGAFPEGAEVSARKLMWLWISEGFIQLKNDETGSLEDVAEKYLNDLIGRSLVIVSQIRSDGGVKASRVHDLLREFALSKAKEEFFLQTPISDLHEVKDPYRLCVKSQREISVLPSTYTPRAHSLLCFNHITVDFWHESTSNLLWDESTSNLLWDESTSSRLKDLKLLRVLHLPPLRSIHFPIIFRMEHLRFLYLRYTTDRILPEVCYLQNLETFVITTSIVVGVVDVPKSIWKLKRLRHFKIDRAFLLPVYSLQHSLKFDNLQTLSMPLLLYGEECEKIMRGLCNLKSLSCIFLDSWDDTSNCNRLPVLDFLTGLETLKLAYRGTMFHFSKIKFPPNLKKLTLSNFSLPWSEISTIGELPNLQVLKLLSRAFMGKTWDMLEGGFRKLKFLKLESLDIEGWNTSEEHLPCLETIVFTECYNLEEIPSCLGDVPTLQRLECHACKKTSRTSVDLIKEKQEDMGNEDFVLKW